MELIQSELDDENCFVCNQAMGSFKTELSASTSYSEKQIYQIIETFTNIEITQEMIYETGICQNCLIKFNEYDEFLTKAENLQTELTNMLLGNTTKYIEAEEEHVDETETVLIKQENIEIDENAVMFQPIYESEEENSKNEIDPASSDYQMEVVVDNIKENVIGSASATKQRILAISKEKPIKSETVDEYFVIEVGQQKLFRCDICEKDFKDRSKLKVHREIHTTERNVICQECGKGFKTMNCLRNHKRMHLPERTYYNCDQCDKKYTQKIQLKKHVEIIHMNRRDFHCPTCGSSFGTKSVLKMHMLSHSGVRNEECSICGFRVHTKAKLRRHLKSHTGERDYQCGICGKKFLYSYNVVAHVRNVHEKNMKNPRTYNPTLQSPQQTTLEEVDVIETLEGEEIEYAYEEC